eukprot:10411815-Lingulodinium_polyedra.AAC.1
MVQSCHFAYMGVSDFVVSKTVFSPPIVAQRANASCTFRALEDGVPQFSIPRLQEISRDIPFFFYIDGPDNCS